MNLRITSLTLLRVLELDVQIVEHDDVDAAVERPRVGLDVGLEGLRGEERTHGALDRECRPA